MFVVSPQLNHSDAYPIPVLYKVFCSLLRVLQRNKNKKILMNKKTPMELLISQGMWMSKQTRRQPQWTKPVRVASAFPGNLLECLGPTQIHWVIDSLGGAQAPSFNKPSRWFWYQLRQEPLGQRYECTLQVGRTEGSSHQWVGPERPCRRSAPGAGPQRTAPGVRNALRRKC